MPTILFMVGIFLIAFIVWRVGQRSSTLPITDASGQPLAGSIAALESITLGGTQQWITLRGKDRSKPVLLYLAGGPGGSDLAWTRKYLVTLEDDFVIVNWDQPGSGKSYKAVSASQLTPERYLNDARELVEHLRTRFDQPKIYLLAHSWGSFLGVWLAQRHPEYFHAYIGCGQMVNTTQNDVMGYELALRELESAGKNKQLEALKKKGPPPYIGSKMVMDYAATGTVTLRYMNAHTPGEDGQGRPNLTKAMFLASEYTLTDKLNVLRGALNTFPVVYPQLEKVDLREQVTCLEIPVWFALGRWDANAMSSLAEQYFQMLEAPQKTLIWFEKSGHLPHYEEPKRFAQMMKEIAAKDSAA